MNVHDTLLHLGILLPERPGAIVPPSADAWFAIAAILTLWAYVMLAPDRTEAGA